jgi:hypothetical protein
LVGALLLLGGLLFSGLLVPLAVVLGLTTIKIPAPLAVLVVVMGQIQLTYSLDMRALQGRAMPGVVTDY